MQALVCTVAHLHAAIDPLNEAYVPVVATEEKKICTQHIPGSYTSGRSLGYGPRQAQL